MNSDETWKPIPGYEGLYEACVDGRVRSLDRPVPHWRGGTRTMRGRVLVGATTGSGYPVVGLSGRDGARRHVLRHRIILETFVGPCPKGHEGSHLNGDRTDASLANLRWETKRQNHARKHEHGTALTGESNPARRLSAAEVRAIRRALDNGEAVRGLARQYNVTPPAIRSIRDRKTWSRSA